MSFELHNGDCLDILPTLAEGSVSLVVTSPPYYNAREYSQYESVERYMSEMKAIFTEVARVMAPSRIVAINISPVLVPRASRNDQSYRIALPFYFVPMMESIGFEFLEDIIWKKPEGSVVNRNGKFSSHRKPVAYKPNVVTEYILVFKKKADFLIDKVVRNESLILGDYDRTNVWEFNPETRSEHPAPFPVTLPQRCIRYYSYENETVLDPFMGSGTTGVAASQSDRKFVGIEKDPEYFAIAKKRIEEVTQKEPLFA